MKRGTNINYKPTPFGNYNVTDDEMYKLTSIEYQEIVVN